MPEPQAPAHALPPGAGAAWLESALGATFTRVRTRLAASLESAGRLHGWDCAYFLDDPVHPPGLSDSRALDVEARFVDGSHARIVGHRAYREAAAPMLGPQGTAHRFGGWESLWTPGEAPARPEPRHLLAHAPSRTARAHTLAGLLLLSESTAPRPPFKGSCITELAGLIEPLLPHADRALIMHGIGDYSGRSSLPLLRAHARTLLRG